MHNTGMIFITHTWVALSCCFVQYNIQNKKPLLGGIEQSVDKGPLDAATVKQSK